MDKSELLTELHLSEVWLHEFVTESNQIDPQPRESGPGSEIYDWHYEALLYVLRVSAEDRYALPKEIHRLLLREHPQAGLLRQHPFRIGVNQTVAPKYVPKLMWRWNQTVFDTVDALRTDDRKIDQELKQADIWGLHCELMNIRPFELFNGKVGRLLMVNHALLVDAQPWLMHSDGREEYFQVIRNHPSFNWATDFKTEQIQL